jgi:hypothetical protein
MPTHTAVIAFVVDAQMDKVDVSNAEDLPSSLTPYPFLKITFPSLTTATASPGTFHNGIACWIYLSKTLLISDIVADFFNELVCDEETKHTRRKIVSTKNDRMAICFKK